MKQVCAAGFAPPQHTGNAFIRFFLPIKKQGVDSANRKDNP